MLEVLLCLTLVGFVIASQKRMEFLNPFQIYFGIWFFLVLGYSISRNTFIPVALEFLLLMIVSKAFALLLLIGVYGRPQKISGEGILEKIPRPRARLLWFAQILTLLAVPFVYVKAVSIAGGDDIFSIAGYMKLRASMTEDGESYGIWSYFSVLSFVTSSILAVSYFQQRVGLLRLLASIVIGLFYVYVSTGRTFVLLFFLLLGFPLVLMKIMRAKGVLIALALMIASFIFVAAMTGKGVSVETGVAENIASLLENLRAYTIAPLLAFSRLVSHEISPDLGLNTFRFAISLFNALGLIDIPPKVLVREYEFVPDATNVYTVYDVYFRDFLYAGVFLPPAFLIGHWWLYRKANNFGGKWIYFYSASLYPLVMQFFQDQYFSLLSTWIQMGFWYWLLLRPKNRAGRGVGSD